MQHYITQLFSFVHFPLSSLSTATCSCYNKGQSSVTQCSVRISFSCFSTSSDLKSCLGQMGHGPILIDARRKDTARKHTSTSGVSSLRAHTRTLRSPPHAASTIKPDTFRACVSKCVFKREKTGWEITNSSTETLWTWLFIPLNTFKTM